MRARERKLSEKTNLFTLPFRFVNLFSVNDDPNRTGCETSTPPQMRLFRSRDFDVRRNFKFVR